MAARARCGSGLAAVGSQACVVKWFINSKKSKFTQVLMAS
jgi:hypothetical protein